jgi:pilus assembly protein CpaE
VLFRLDLVSLINTRRMLTELQNWEIDENRVLLVANRCGQPGEIPPSKVKSILGRSQAMCIPEDQLTANLSINCGNPAVLESPKAPLSRAIAQLVDRLLPASAEERRDCTPDPENGSHGFPNDLLRRATALFC